MRGLRCAALSDTGRKRKSNQDAHVADPELGLFAVADGMGGHAGGERASAEAVGELRRDVQARLRRLQRPESQSPPRDQLQRLLRDALRAASARVHGLAQANPELSGMGTTLTALLLFEDRAYIGHVGDTRAYLLRQGKQHRLTHDHRVVDELIRRGALRPEDAGEVPYTNALSRCIGAQPKVQVDVLDLDLMPGDRFLLCCDGVHGYFADEDLPAKLAGDDLQAVAQGLVDHANAAGGEDNITVLLVEVARSGADAPASAAETSRRLEQLRSLPVLRGLDYREAITVLGLGRSQDYQAGQEVMAEGLPIDALVIVLYGRLRLLHSGRMLAEFVPGDSFGEEGILDGGPAPADLVADEATRVLRLPRAGLLELLRQDPLLAGKLLAALLQSLAGRSRRTLERVAAREPQRASPWAPKP